MHVRDLVYSDSVIAVALISEYLTSELKDRHLGIKWLSPGGYADGSGKRQEITNVMGGETEWFVVPYSLAVGIARVLFEKHAAGAEGSFPGGLRPLAAWLVELGDLSSAVGY